MGLAQKMAQSNGAGGAPAQPQQQQQAAQQHQQAPQQSYGAPSGPPGGQYGAPAGAPGGYAPPAGAPPPINTSARPTSQQYPASPAYTPSPGHGQQQAFSAQQQVHGQDQKQQFSPSAQQQGFAPPPGAPPAAAYGQPQQHIAPAATAVGAAADPRQIQSVFEQCVADQNIQAFYPPGSLVAIAQRVAQSGALDSICRTWNLPMELAMDLIKLALFDVVCLIDDSMVFEEQGERINDLKLILGKVAFVASLLDSDGIQVRFLNNRIEGNGIRSEQDTLNLVNGVRFSGLTPLGTSLDQKILQPLILGPARAGQLQKPVLVIAITDGQPAGEPRETVTNVIINCSRELARTRYGPDALSITFAQVGDDAKAQAFLGELDTHPIVGGLVDCISNYEREEEEMLRKSGMQLTPDLWLLKLIAGGIDSSYDEQDE